MTNKEAIAILSNFTITLPEGCTGINAPNAFREAYFLAIKALENEPKKGKWEKYLDMRLPWAKCSACNWDSCEPYVYAVEHFKYCPKCGADMREVVNE